MYVHIHTCMYMNNVCIFYIIIFLKNFKFTYIIFSLPATCTSTVAVAVSLMLLDFIYVTMVDAGASVQI